MRELDPVDVVVLGGGPAGLSAAWALADGGASVLVVERESDTGGLCRTHARAGYRFDMGGHRFITADQDLLDRVVRLLGPDLLLAERTSEVALLGRRFKYPLELPDLLRNLPPGLALRALGSYLARRLKRASSEPENFEDWASERFGKVLYELFIGPYTEKVWGVHPRELSTEWATQRISVRHLGEALRAMLPGAGGEPARTHAKTFLYPRLGMGQLFERVRQAAEAGGARVLTDSCAVGVERTGARISALVLETPDGLARVRCGQVLSTIPLPALLDLALGPDALPAERGALAFRPVRFLNIALERPEALPTTWRYVGERQYRAGRLQEPRRRSAFMAPPGKSSLMVEVPHAVGDAVDRADDARLLRSTQVELEQLGVSLGDGVAFAFSVRAPEAYPVHVKATAPARAAALNALDGISNLRTFGRQGAFRFVFSDAAMRMGLLAADGLLQSAPPTNQDLAQVASARTLTEVASIVGRDNK